MGEARKTSVRRTQPAAEAEPIRGGLKPPERTGRRPSRIPLVNPLTTAKANGSAGEALPRHVKGDMESRFGRDLSAVRVHRDTRSAEMSRSLNALAFTQNRDIYFGAEAPRPDSAEGQTLLAHELVHTMQGGEGPTHGAVRVSDPGEPAERQATAVSQSLSRGDQIAPDAIKPAPYAAGVLWRQTAAPVAVIDPSENFPGANGFANITDAELSDGTLHEEERVWLTVQHPREFELRGPILHYERIIDVRAKDGTTAHVVMKGETDFPLGYSFGSPASAGDLFNALRSRSGASQIGLSLKGKEADGTPVTGLITTEGEYESLQRLAGGSQEMMHFGLNPEQQYRAVLKAMAEAKLVNVPKPGKAEAKTTPTPETKPTEDEAFSKKSEDEKASDFWNQVKEGVKSEALSLVLAAIVGALLAALAVIAIFAEGVIAIVAIAILALAIVGGFIYLLYKMISDLIDRLKAGEWAQAAVGLLKDLALVAAAILGALALVVAIVLAPELAVGIGLLALAAVGVAVVAMIALYFIQRNEAIKSKDPRTFKQKVGEAVNTVTEGLSTLISVVVAWIVGGIGGRLALGPKLPPPEFGPPGKIGPPVEIPPDDELVPAAKPPAPAPTPAAAPKAPAPAPTPAPKAPAPGSTVGPAAAPKAPQEPLPNKPITPQVPKEPLPGPQPAPAEPAAPAPHPTIDAPPGVTVDARTAGTGGIERINARVNNNNENVVSIYGKIRPQIPRQGFEDAIPPARNIDALRNQNYDNAHLWGRQFGDEAGAGVMHAPAEFNEVQQRVLEGQIKGLGARLKPGEELLLRARATSFPRDQYGGACARRYEYDFAIRTASGGVSDRTGIVFDLPPPGSADRAPIVRIVPGGLPSGW